MWIAKKIIILKFTIIEKSFLQLLAIDSLTFV